jgi:uncharacterized protein with PQ loop repeat
MGQERECTCFSLNSSDYDYVAAEWFQECLFTRSEVLSFRVGMLSLLFWILCQLPQIMRNFRTKSVEGLATFLILQWFCGDVMNFVGSILTRQLSFQKLSAAVFVSMDITMMLQKLYYSKVKLAKVSVSSSSTQPLLIAFAMIMIPALTEAQVEESISMIQSCEPYHEMSPFSLTLGSVLGSLASCMYVGSRFSQISKNRQRQSTEGIAPSMFMFAVLGNLTYSIGIILRQDHIVKASPWLAGSLACMSLDIFILSQTYRYSKSANELSASVT